MAYASNIAHYLIGLQTDKTTPATAYRKCKAAGDPSLMPVRDIARLEETDASRDRSDAYVSRLAVEGDLPILMRPEIASDIMFAVLGTRSSLTGTDTVTPADALPWWTIHRMFGNVIRESYVGAKIHGVTLESSTGGPLTATLSVAAIEARWITPEPTPSQAVDDEPFFHSDICGQLTLGGLVRRPASVSISIQNGGGGYQSDCLTLEDIDVGQRAVDGSWTERFHDVDEYRKSYYGTAAGTVLAPNLTREALIIRWDKASNTPFFELNFAKVLRAGYPIQPSPGGDPVEVDVAFEAEKPTGGVVVTATATTPPVIT